MRRYLLIEEFQDEVSFHWLVAGYHEVVEGLEQVNQVIVGADNTDG